MRKASTVTVPSGTPGVSRDPLPDTALLLGQLRSQGAQAGWEEFLRQYSAILYQAVHTFTRDEDKAGDCFVHICEQLARNGFRRLLQFKSDGPASFSTWLQVVVRNLCYDWHRKRHGRLRPFKSIQNFSPLEHEVYRCRYERGLSREETLQQLLATWPTVKMDELADIEARIENSLSSRQHWLLSAWKQRESRESISETEQEARDQAPATMDTGPDPEAIAADSQQQAKLQKCIGLLLPTERLIVQLRFEDELSLDEIARLTGLGDAQRVHRRLTAILQKLRVSMDARSAAKIGGHVREIRRETKQARNGLP
jgi:RNA polymerase sigma factor (sigma-70 family)